MNFQELLGTLARSSAQAVSTLKKSSDEVERLRSYLYVETDIEKRFVELLQSSPPANSIIFLCGSSGDGKSEILRRHHETYSPTYRFHLDATHSFRPDQSAVEALNQLFDEHGESDRPLIVGINIGMMFNFQNTGAERHSSIRHAIGRFIEGEREVDNCYFISFEDYPKFSLEEGNVGSPFIFELVSRVTASKPENPLYAAYQDDASNHHLLEYQNYRILQEEPVQRYIVRLLLYVRLKYDLFFSARAILDFIYNLIAGGSTLFDNLFCSKYGGISDSLAGFDPCLIRTQKIDEFVVNRSLDIGDELFEDFKSECQQRYGLLVSDPGSWIRAFCVLRAVDIGNNFHKNFFVDSDNNVYEDYIRIWQLHQNLSDRRKLRDFYDKTLIASLTKFANRLAPNLSGDALYLTQRNGVTVSAKVRVSLDAKSISEVNVGKKIHCFYAAVKVGEDSLLPFPVTVSFLELAERIMAGYRPNRYDKNTVVILEEVVEEVVRVASKSKALYFNTGNSGWALRLEDDDFLVEACQ